MRRCKKTITDFCNQKRDEEKKDASQKTAEVTPATSPRRSV